MRPTSNAIATSAKPRASSACRATRFIARSRNRSVERQEVEEWRSAMFEPINRVERLMQAAAADPKQIPGFYAALLEAELFVLTPETEVGPEGRRSLKANEPFTIATIEFNGLRWHPAFTAKERISTYLTEPETCLGAKARDL